MTYHKGGSVRKALTFDAQNSNFDSWFQQRKLTESPWSDLKAYKEIGYFSFKGYCRLDNKICQNFHITKGVRDPKCHEVFGWTYRGTFDSCNWEKSNLNAMVYCAQQTICQFHKEGEFSHDLLSQYVQVCTQLRTLPICENPLKEKLEKVEKISPQSPCQQSLS